MAEITDASPGQGSHKGAGGILCRAVIAGASGVNHGHAHVRDDALGQSGLEGRVLFEQFLALKEFIQHHGGLHARDMLPRGDLTRCEVHNGLVRLPVAVVKQLDKSLTRHAVAFFESEYDVPGWLMHGYRDEANRVT